MISGILYVMTHKQLKIGFFNDYKMTNYTQELDKATATSNQVSSALACVPQFPFYLDVVMKLFKSCRLMTELSQGGLLNLFQ